MKTLRKLLSRNAMAHIFMLSAIILVGVGIGGIDVRYGLATGGTLLGAYGYLLGAE